MRYPSLESGRLDKRVTIQTVAESPDGAGGQNRIWNDTLTVWAAIDQGTGREFAAAQQVQPELSHVVTIRYRSGITSKMRIKYIAGGVTRTFSIHSPIDPLERHEQLQLYCSEILKT